MLLLCTNVCVLSRYQLLCVARRSHSFAVARHQNKLFPCASSAATGELGELGKRGYNDFVDCSKLWKSPLWFCFPVI